MSFDPSPARKGLDALLERYPHFDLLSVDWQIGSEYRSGAPDWTYIVGPWLLVTLGEPSDTSTPEPIRAWARWEFAIWKHTGAVHSMEGGAVSDDPIFTPDWREPRG